MRSLLQKKYISLSIIFILIIGIIVTVLLSQKQQDIRQRASESTQPTSAIDEFVLFDAHSLYFDRNPYSLGQRPIASFPPGKTANDLIRDYDSLVFAISVQGNVNRSKPTFYISTTDVDDEWRVRLARENIWLKNTPSRLLIRIEDVINEFKQSKYGFQGSVVWDDEKPFTLNLAVTIAGAENLVIVRRGSPLFQQITESFPVRVDLRGRFNSKKEGYMWLTDNYLKTGKVNPILGYFKDGYPVKLLNQGKIFESAGINNTEDVAEGWGMMMDDYLIAKKGFAFDLAPDANTSPNDEPNQTRGEDRQTLQYITDAARSIVGQGKLIDFWGYVNKKYLNSTCTNLVTCGENSFIDFVSRNGGVSKMGGGESYGIDFPNGSFYQHGPGVEFLPQNPPLTPRQLVDRGYVTGDPSEPSSLQINPNKKFVLLYMGDFDYANALYSIPFYRMPCPHQTDQGACNQVNSYLPIWDKRTSNIPVAWGINADIAKAFPPLFAYVAKTKNAGDYFVMPNSGTGYVKPGGLPDNVVSEWIKQATSIHRQYGYRMGWVLNGYESEWPAQDTEQGRKIRDMYKVISPEGFLYNASFSSQGAVDRMDDDGFVALPMDNFSFQGLTVGNVKCAFSKTFQECPADSPNGMLEKAPNRQFFALRNVFIAPDLLQRAFTDMHDEKPDVMNNIAAVDPQTFLYLFRMSKLKFTYDRATVVDVKVNGNSEIPTFASPNTPYTVEITLRNDGFYLWRTSTHKLRYAVVSGDITPSGLRQRGQVNYPFEIPFARNVAPGESITFTATITTPITPGVYTAQIDLEGGDRVLAESVGNVPWQKKIIVVTSSTPTVTPLPTITGTFMIHGVLYKDNNRNGRRDADELSFSSPNDPPVYMHLLRNDTQIATENVSVQNGLFLFTHLPLGTYTLSLTPVAGYTNSNTIQQVTITQGDVGDVRFVLQPISQISLTPQPTNTPSQAGIPSPTPSPTLSRTTIQLFIALTGIGQGVLENDTPYTALADQQFTIEIYDANDNLIESGVISVPIYIPFVNTDVGPGITVPRDSVFLAQYLTKKGLAEGNYIIKVKSDKYLRKRIAGFHHLTAGTVYKAPLVILTVGDVNSDNKLDIADYNLYRGCYGKTINDMVDGISCKMTDFNDDARLDNRVSEKDYRLLIASFSVREGD